MYDNNNYDNYYCRTVTVRSFCSRFIYIVHRVAHWAYDIRLRCTHDARIVREFSLRQNGMQRKKKILEGVVRVYRYCHEKRSLHVCTVYAIYVCISYAVQIGKRVHARDCDRRSGETGRRYFNRRRRREMPKTHDFVASPILSRHNIVRNIFTALKWTNRIKL